MRDFTQSRSITLGILLAAMALGACSVALELRALDRVRNAMSIRAFITRINALELHVLDYEETALRTLGGVEDASPIDGAYERLTEHIAALRVSGLADALVAIEIDDIERALAESKRGIDEALSSQGPPLLAEQQSRQLATLRALREIRHAVNNQRSRLIDEVREITHTMSLIRTMTLLTVGLALFVGLQSIRVQRASNRLRASESRHRALFESSRDAIIVADDEGRFLQANAAAAEMFGVPRERVQTMRVSDLRVPEGDQPPTDAYQRYLRTGNESGEFRYLREGGVERVAEFTAMRVGDNLHMSILRDVTERRRAEAELIEALRRFECVVKATEDTVWDWDIVADEMHWSQTFTDVYGYAERVIRPATPWIRQRIHPDDRDRVERSVYDVLDGETQHWECEYRFQRLDGSYAVVFDRGHVLRDERGKAVRMIGAMIDFTQRRAQEVVIRESEARFRAMADSSPMLIWVTGRDRQCEYVNRAWLEFSGRSFEEMIGRGWTRGIHPSDAERMEEQVRAAVRRRESFTVEYRYRRADGEHRWLVDTGAPRFLDNGEFAGYVGSCIDITERTHAEERLKLLNRELNHRVKNNLAAVQVLAERTADGSASLVDFRAAFAGRINALARMHDLTLLTPGEDMTLDAVIRLTLEAYDHPCDHAVVVDCDDVVVSKAAGSAINMIVHELATNAVKHGALSVRGGRVVVRSNATPDGVVIEWIERGGPPARRPAKYGFGFELIEGATRHELNGRVTWGFDREGLRCVIEIPHASIVPTPQDQPSRVPLASKR